MRSEWKDTLLGKVVNFRRGYDLTRKNMNMKGNYPVVGSNGIIGFHDEATANPLLTIGRSGNVGTPHIVPTAGWAHNTTLYVDDFKGNDPLFLYYLLKTLKLESYGSGSAVPTLNRNHIHPIKISFPSKIKIQHSIADLLNVFDAKIELNNRINENLEQQAQAIFKSWFVDFEPFQDGRFVESELGLIPEGWRVGKIGEIIELHDSKRIPLSARERFQMDKIYPYYGAAALLDYVDGYLFDGIYLLLGEDGTVVDDLGYPILQYVYGKFWVNNHAHVITGKNGYSVEHLYMLLKNTNVISAITGAVQKKINQRNLKSLPVVLAPLEEVAKFNDSIASIFSIRRIYEKQNEVLSSIRDTLLPRLMSGELEVPVEV